VNAEPRALEAPIVCRDLVVEIDGNRLVDRVSFSVAAGEWLTIVGPNGAGKTTLLRACAGLLPITGRVELRGAELGALRPRARARAVALVPQQPVIPTGVAVVDYVLLGRTPHVPFFGSETDEDVDVVHETLRLLDLDALAGRTVESLSGGERQRVLLARALAQRTPLVLLDEPTTALDIGHQQEVLDLVDRLRGDHDLAIVSSMHDLTLAGQYADRLALLDAGRLVAEGSADAVLTEENLARHYGARVRVMHEESGIVIVPDRRSRAGAWGSDVEAAP
jgi:iron complex transport system ATP-binding protein